MLHARRSYEMVAKNMNYLHILLYCFIKIKRSAEIHRKIFYVYRNNAVRERFYQKWFTRFRSEYFNINDAPVESIMVEQPRRGASLTGLGLPSKINSIHEWQGNCWCESFQKIASALNIPFWSVENHLRQLEYISLSMFVFQTDANLINRIFNLRSLLKRQREEYFFE